MATQKQIDANRKNWQKRKGLTEAGRERLRLAARRSRPWEHSSGPKSARGKAVSRTNALKGGAYANTVEPFASIGHLNAHAGWVQLDADLRCMWSALGEPAPENPFAPLMDLAISLLKSRCPELGIKVADFIRRLEQRILKDMTREARALDNAARV